MTAEIQESCDACGAFEIYEKDPFGDESEWNGRSIHHKAFGGFLSPLHAFRKSQDAQTNSKTLHSYNKTPSHRPNKSNRMLPLGGPSQEGKAGASGEIKGSISWGSNEKPEYTIGAGGNLCDRSGNKAGADYSYNSTTERHKIDFSVETKKIDDHQKSMKIFIRMRSSLHEKI